jgi:flagellin
MAIWKPVAMSTWELNIMAGVSALDSFYNSRLSTLKSQIDTITNELQTGKKTTTAAQQAQVTSLSARAVKYSTANTNINQAKNVIGVATTALTSIADQLKKMQRLANQAAAPGMSNTDYMNLNNQFQRMMVELGGYAVKASVNGTNLLSGTAVMNVKSGIDNGPKSNTTVMPVNIMGMIRVGSLSNAALDSKETVAQAADAIRAAMSVVNNGQAQLKQSIKTLTTIQSVASASTRADQQTINSLQGIDVPALQRKLTELKAQQTLDFNVLTQLNANAADNLTPMA